MLTSSPPLISARLESARSGPSLRIVVPNRIAPLATTRNRIRRRIRETIRALRIGVPSGKRLTINVRDAALPAPAPLTDLLVLTLRKSGIVHR